MKIISKFKDYYDIALNYGIDENCAYIRKTRTEQVLIDKPFVLGYYDIIGFCGNIYVAFVNNYINFDPKTDVYYEEDCFNYSFDFSDFQIKPINKIDFFSIYLKTDTIKRNQKIYNELKNNSWLKSLFYKLETPIFRIKYTQDRPYKHSTSYANYNNDNKLNIIVNPNLSEIGFYKVVDTVQAFQQIQQFISNNLISQPDVNIPTGNDEVVGNSKGFNRWSFRKQSKKSKQPKKF